MNIMGFLGAYSYYLNRVDCSSNRIESPRDASVLVEGLHDWV
jgi:hypothetical protein